MIIRKKTDKKIPYFNFAHLQHRTQNVKNTRVNGYGVEVLLTVQFAESSVELVQAQTAILVHVFEADHVGHNTHVRYVVQFVLFIYLKM